LALLVAFAAATPGYAKEGPQAVPLLDHPIRSDCETGAISGGIPTNAFAAISFPGDKRANAVVTFKDGQPNTTYGISLVQTPSGENCNHAETTLTTNGKGHGRVRLSELLFPGTTGAWIQAFTPAYFTGNFAAHRVTVMVPVT
jgi:hypothetical protein